MLEREPVKHGLLFCVILQFFITNPLQATRNLRALRAHCAKQTEVKTANMNKTIKGRLKLKMRLKIQKKRNAMIVVRLNEFLADPSSDEVSDTYSEDEEKAQRINELM